MKRYPNKQGRCRKYGRRLCVAAAFLVVVTLLAAFPKIVSASDFEITLNSTNVELDIKLRVINGRVMAPLKPVCDLLGIGLYWDADERTAYVSKGNLSAYHRAQTNEINLNNEHFQFDIISVIVDGRIFMPLNMLAKITGSNIEYTEKSSTISISYDFGFCSVSLGKKAVSIGESAESVKKTFGEPQRVARTPYSFDWYSYTADYNNFILIGIQNNIVMAFYTNSKNFVYCDGTAYGMEKPDDVSSASPGLTFFTDAGNNSKIYAIYVNQSIYTPQKYLDDFAAISKDEERTLFELTNGFRRANSRTALEYDSAVAEVAKKHSVNMATGNFFNHVDSSNKSPGKRLKDANIFYKRCAENIAGGSMSIVLCFDQLVNSGSHRDTILSSNYGICGVGIAYSAESEYKYYYTQVFLGR